MKLERPAQQSLALPKPRGGKRPGAGRPANGPRASEPHKTRPYLAARCPVHVTVRVVRDVAPLRTRALYRAIRWATLTAAQRDREHFRIIHVSIQRTHVHLVVEARDRMKLARGVQSFEISAARLINRACARRGAVFPDRYHAHILQTPSEVRRAVSYVLLNWRKHHEDRRVSWRLDPYSTAISFPHWRELAHSPFLYRPPPRYERLVTYLPRTWLLRNAFAHARHPSVYDTPSRG